MDKPLSDDFYARDVVLVAQELIGKKLIRRINGKTLIGIISETEAYRSDEPACHAHRGKTERNKSLFGPVGHVYVYISYGLHYCFNIVSGQKEYYPAGGVLIRAIIPLKGLDFMIQNRNKSACDVISKLTIGPGNVAQALSITLADNGVDVTKADSQLIITQGSTLPDTCISSTKRIGITKAADKLWRFVLKQECIAKL